MSTSSNRSTATTVHVVTLGCARNEVDSEELAARLEAGGFQLVEDPVDAEALLVNTCGFIEQAKKDSVDTILGAADLKTEGQARAIVAVGCMAERYGRELAESLPEADAVLGFDDYPDIVARLNAILAGHRSPAYVPRDRRLLLPLSPLDRPAASGAVPGHQDPLAGIAPASGPRVLRRRLSAAPSAPLKIASGCDRRCAFCAIPSFRGAYLSRPWADILREAQWLADSGVREVTLVSENSSSYGKDLGDLRALERLLAELDKVDGLHWVRISYLQPAEIRPSLIEVMTSSAKVVPYFDLSFQHASEPLLRRMRRFGSADSFGSLLDSIRDRSPHAGVRSNFIVGFPGETDRDYASLEHFLMRARLDAIGVFAYSDEEGTEAAALDGHLPTEVIDERYRRLSDLAESLCDERAEDRIGEKVQVLVELVGEDVVGRAAHQGPEVDGSTSLVGWSGKYQPCSGDLVSATVRDCSGVDLVAVVDPIQPPMNRKGEGHHG